MIALDFAQLRPIGLQQAIASAAAQLDLSSSSARLMRVSAVHRDSILVHDGSQESPALILPRLLHELQTCDALLTVGDWIAAEYDLHDTLWITAHLSPVTQIARRGNDGRRQVLASNVDTALLRDARRGEETPLERISARAKWKTILKAGQERGRQKRQA